MIDIPPMKVYDFATALASPFGDEWVPKEETTRWSQDAMNHIVELDLDVDYWRAMYFDLLKLASQREWKHNIRQLNNPTFEGEDSE